MKDLTWRDGRMILNYFITWMTVWAQVFARNFGSWVSPPWEWHLVLKATPTLALKKKGGTCFTTNIQPTDPKMKYWKCQLEAPLFSVVAVHQLLLLSVPRVLPVLWSLSWLDGGSHTLPAWQLFSLSCTHTVCQYLHHQKKKRKKKLLCGNCAKTKRCMWRDRHVDPVPFVRFLCYCFFGVAEALGGDAVGV